MPNKEPKRVYSLGRHPGSPDKKYSFGRRKKRPKKFMGTPYVRVKGPLTEKLMLKYCAEIVAKINQTSAAKTVEQENKLTQLDDNPGASNSIDTKFCRKQPIQIKQEPETTTEPENDINFCQKFQIKQETNTSDDFDESMPAGYLKYPSITIKHEIIDDN